MSPSKTKKKGAKKGKQEMTPKVLQGVINKRWGAGTMKMASDPSLRIQRLPSGILSVDTLIGGGFARNRHAEIYGSANVGKNYLAFNLIKTTQELGGRCAFIDVEKTFDPRFAENVGVNLDELAYHEQFTGPRCVDFSEFLLRSKLYDVIVLDSIASLLPQAEYENDMEAGSYGMEQAKLMSKALRKLTAANSLTALVFLNQTREAIGVTFGKKTITSGGRAMGFYSGLRLEMVRTEQLTRTGRTVDHKTGEVNPKGKVVYGHRVLVRGEKDKTGGLVRPQAETTFVFNYERGRHDHIEDLIYLGLVHDLIHKKKSGGSGKGAERWSVDGYEDEECSGRPRFKKWLKRNRAVAEELEELIKEAVATEREADEEEAE